MTPFHHAAVGYLLAQGRGSDWRRDLLVVTCALLPDVDAVVPGMHHTFGHSLYVGPIALLLVGLGLGLKVQDHMRCQAAFLAHLGLDFIAITGRVFWPFSWIWPWGTSGSGFDWVWSAALRDRFPLVFTIVVSSACVLVLWRRSRQRSVCLERGD